MKVKQEDVAWVVNRATDGLSAAVMDHVAHALLDMTDVNADSVLSKISDEVHNITLDVALRNTVEAAFKKGMERVEEINERYNG